MTETADKAREESSGNSSSSGSKLKFSETHGSETGDMFLTFTEYEYKRTDQGSIFNPTSTGTQITLPIPYNLHPQYNAQWNGGIRQGAWGEMVSNSAGPVLNGIISSINSQSMGPISDSIFNGMNIDRAAVKALSALGTDVLAGRDMFQSAGIGAGIARNPFLATAFEGMQFRVFNFDYKLYAKDASEAKVIQQIIKAFRYGMHPAYQKFGSLKNALFHYPYMYKPEFTKSFKDNLFEFGYCVITELSINYHDEGTPKYFDADGEKMPAFVSMQIGMQELEINTKDNLQK